MDAPLSSSLFSSSPLLPLLPLLFSSPLLFTNHRTATDAAATTNEQLPAALEMADEILGGLGGAIAEPLLSTAAKVRGLMC